MAGQGEIVSSSEGKAKMNELLQVSAYAHIYEYEEHKEKNEGNGNLDTSLVGIGKSLPQGEIIKCKVIGITNRHVAVDAGAKVAGLIPRSELKYLENLKIGDEIEVLVLQSENEKGAPVLSHSKAKMIRGWEKVNSAHEKRETLEAFIKHKTKGGVIAEVEGIECFLPNSQIEEGGVEDPSAYIGKKLPVKVIKINPQIKNVVISHKAYLDEQKLKEKEDLIKKFQPGYICEGIVKNITSFGVFVNLGGIDGLIHIKDLHWYRISHPEEVVKVGQKIKCVVISFSPETGKLVLGHKQLLPHPWENLPEEIKVGNVVKGKIVSIQDFGVFVEIARGIEGVMPIHEISWQKITRSFKVPFKVGDEVEVKILSIDKEKHKMVLSRKALIPDPWENIEAKYPLETIVKGKVIAITPYKAILEIEPGIEGELDVKDISWTKFYKNVKEALKIGDEIDVMVMAIDVNKRIIKVSKKHTTENPWPVYETIYTVGSEHEGVVLKIEKTQATILLLPHGVEATAKLANLRKVDGKLPSKDEKLKFQVVKFDTNAKVIEVSHLHTYKAKKEEEKKKPIAKPTGHKAPPPQRPKITIGDIMKQSKKNKEGDSKDEK